MRKKSEIIRTVVPICLSLLLPPPFGGCARTVDEETVYRETYMLVCDDLDAAASDMEVVVYGAAEPSPDWETLEGNAESTHRVFLSCERRMSSVNVPGKYADGHRAFVESLEKGSAATEAMLDAVRARDREAVDKAAADFEEAGRYARTAAELLAEADR
jgi:hypothetical protein